MAKPSEVRTRLHRAALALFLAIPMLVTPGGGALEREVKGNILLPQPGTARTQRCLETSLGEITQGTAGWVLDATGGAAFSLKADISGDDFDIYFYDDLGLCQDSKTAASSSAEFGDESGTVPLTASKAIVLLIFGQPGAAFTYRESDPPVADGRVTGADPKDQEFTVVALVDFGFSPYHYDFIGHQHPWNLDGDASNNFDAYADPATYISGYPGSTPLDITIPTDENQDVSGLADKDKAQWDKMKYSTPEQANLYRFPGTKVIGALNFEVPSDLGPLTEVYPFHATNSDHGTRSAASLAGNIHGTCPECLIVMIHGLWHEAVAWAASQPWIDVITNSWGENLTGAARDGVSLYSPVEITREAVQRGQTITWSAGNGLLNAFDVPQLTYTSSQKGPDWIVTVGAAEPETEQTYSGSGKPVDITSIGRSYPSSGGNTANGTGTHSGTSNASPVIGGTFANLIQKSRMLLNDVSEGNAAGVVASGSPFACGAANRSCVLSDGVLTRDELQQVVFSTVLPSPMRLSFDPTWPSSEYSYYYQGHGVLSGRAQSPEEFQAEQQGLIDVLTGNADAPARPAGERNWFITDSKCRQRLWGTWSGGYFQGDSPSLNRLTDPIASAFEEWCSEAEQDAFLQIARDFGDQEYVPPDTPLLATAPAPGPPSSGPATAAAPPAKPKVVREVRVVEKTVEGPEVVRTVDPPPPSKPRALRSTVAGADSRDTSRWPSLLAALLTAVAAGLIGFRSGISRRPT